MNEVTPITPDELLEYVRNHPNIPDFIIHTVNELIKKSWDGEKAIVHQDIIFEKLQIPDEWLKERGLAHKGLQEIKKYIYNTNYWILNHIIDAVDGMLFTIRMVLTRTINLFTNF